MKTSQGFVPPKALYNKVEIDQIVFSVLAPEQIQNWSVMEVTESKIYEGIYPKRDGVNDSRLGIVKAGQKCETCGQTRNCPGHFGHIKLAEPVYHVGFMKYVVRILKCICLHCSRIKYYKSEEQKMRFEQIIRIGSPARRMLELSKLLGNISICPLVDENGQKLGCGSYIPTKFTVKEKMRLFVIQKEDKKNEVQYSAAKVRNIFSKMHADDCKLLGFTQSKPINMIITLLPVAPPQVRPSVQLGPDKRAEDDITNAYSRIITFNNQIKQGLDNYRRSNNLKEIQKLTAAIMVKLDKKYLPVLKDKFHTKNSAAKKIKSLEERLVAKEGRFRQHLMGKRVDFCARSVITPDPFIALDELGVPQTIANTLTFPEQINQFNYERILELCKKGKVRFLVHPTPPQGKPELCYIYLNKYKKEQIEQFVRIGMIAERELENGDYVLFNRQPTLHRMSMMGHRVRILPHNTFRLNLSVCSPYNADFDGDQMNMHVPQTIEAVAQLQFLASVPYQIMNPKNSTPIMGIVQDSLLGVYLMTMRDTFITKAQLMNLIMWMDPLTKFEVGDLPIPCILKPEPLWSGKQVISMIIPERTTLSMNLRPQTKINISDKQNLIIKNGQLLSGVLKRDHVGPGCGKLIQAIWVQKGPQGACNFITNIQKVVTNWFMSIGFSVGFADVMPSNHLQDQRLLQIQQTKSEYYRNIHLFRNLPKYQHENLHQKGKKISESHQFKVNMDLNNALSRMQSIVVNSVSAQKNNICKMIDAKSKGSETNMTQIMFCLGNQNVDGQRCPQGFSKRALPHFSKNDNSPQPRGFVFSSFFDGLKPHEFFFHSMAGREGLSDTAVKTSNIGYLQRKLVKALEDVSVRYDGTVRDSKDNILQRFYGEDGFQPQFIEKHQIKQCSLSQKQFQQIYKWQNNQLKSFKLNSQQKKIIEDEYTFLLQFRNALRKRAISQGERTINYQSPINIERLVNQEIQSRKLQSPADVVTPALCVQIVEQLSRYCVLPRFRKLYKDQIQDVENKQKQGKISRSGAFQFKKNLLKEYGSQIFHIHIKFWLSSRKVCQKYKFNENELNNVVNRIKSKYKKVISPAGQAIGSLAAQSIGEPTTQMTLNTFHLAGVADKNVTLGIPRLRELLSVSKEIQTPYTTIYPKCPLYWEDRQDEDSKLIQNSILQVIPERSIMNYISQTEIYFDPGKKCSNIDQSPIEELPNVSRTPWVISVYFEKDKITSVSTWRLIRKALEDHLGREFNITQYVGFGDSKSPQINLRLNPETIKNIVQGNIYKHVALRQIELKDYPLSGIKGISSVKSAKKKGFIVRQFQQLTLELQQQRDEIIFEAMGNNFQKILSHPLVDSQRTISNNIKEVYNTLGIEAARTCFLNEFKEVLKPYNITINHRHIDVLTQWMTLRGNIIPINRHGINRVKDVSVLRKATFQETIDVLYDAAVFSETDQLRGVSEKIIFGQKLSIGTNVCKIYVDQNKVANYVYQPKNQLNDFNALREKEEQEQQRFIGGMDTPLGFQTPVRSFSPQNSFSSTPLDTGMFSPLFTETSYKAKYSTLPSPTYSALPSPTYSRVSNDNNKKFTRLGDSGVQSERLTDKSPIYPTKFKRALQKSEPTTFIKEYSESPNYNTHSQLSQNPYYSEETNTEAFTSRPVRPSQGNRMRNKYQKDLEESDSD